MARVPAAWRRSRNGNVSWQTGQEILKNASRTGPRAAISRRVAAPPLRSFKRTSGTCDPASRSLGCFPAAILRVYDGGVTKILRLNLPCYHPLAVFLPRLGTHLHATFESGKELRSSQSSGSKLAGQQALLFRWY